MARRSPGDRRPSWTDMPAATIGPMPERIGPWTRNARRVAYENPWIVVWHDDVTRPDGDAGIYGVVGFRNVAVGVVAIDDEDRVVLVGQHRYTLDAWSWEIPEGGVPTGEDPLDGARRELAEETGYRAATWQEVGRAHLSNSVSDELAVMYLATGLSSGTSRPEGTEALEVRSVPFAEALAMVLDGRITDALSALAIQRVALTR
jgi:8-oxo-dGTP pyrophosphatase MutT (NUDIX family)